MGAPTTATARRAAAPKASRGMKLMHFMIMVVLCGMFMKSLCEKFWKSQDEFEVIVVRKKERQLEGRGGEYLYSYWWLIGCLIHSFKMPYHT